jgi:DNA polymerase III alpha subunit
MKVDNYGQFIYTEDEICDIIYRNPTQNISSIIVEKGINFDEILELQNVPEIIVYVEPSMSFDETNQHNYYVPVEYKSLDIAAYVLDKCKTEEELQRAGEELLLFQQLNMFNLLVYLKYLVDTMRKNNIVWGVGRGSSVASFVLYLIGIHKINSLYYDLPINEFIRYK